MVRGGRHYGFQSGSPVEHYLNGRGIGFHLARTPVLIRNRLPSGDTEYRIALALQGVRDP